MRVYITYFLRYFCLGEQEKEQNSSFVHRQVEGVDDSFPLLHNENPFGCGWEDVKCCRVFLLYRFDPVKLFL